LHVTVTVTVVFVANFSFPTGDRKPPAHGHQMCQTHVRITIVVAINFHFSHSNAQYITADDIIIIIIKGGQVNENNQLKLS